MYRLLTILCLFVLLASFSMVGAQTYVGSSTCMICHNTVNPNVGYNIWEEYMKSGHPYKLNPVSGGPPTYPPNTSPGVPAPPAAPNWNDYSYVIGGYGWKARFVKTNGRIFTADSSAQYNLETGGWVPYHYGEDKKYNYDCFQCHTTGPDPNGSWNGVPSDSLGTFNEPGIRCEGCHGPGSDHVGNPTGVHPPNQGETLEILRCGECHHRGSLTNAIPASGGYIRHHEQYNELQASYHRDGQGGELTCASCHDNHIALRYPAAAGSGLSGIKTQCETCHPNHEITVTTPGGSFTKSATCVDCHMAPAAKSAVGMQAGNGWRGDVKSHIFNINTNAVPRDSMFAGGVVKLDANGHGHITLDFVCLRCHTTKDLNWAASFASNIHAGITDLDDNLAELPSEFELLQNYPNPFNPSTTIEFRLPQTSKVRLVVYNMIGQVVANLLEETMPAGSHTVTFDASNLSSGLYIYRLESENVNLTQKMVLMK